jgi:hypothetical protein
MRDGHIHRTPPALGCGQGGSDYIADLWISGENMKTLIPAFSRERLWGVVKFGFWRSQEKEEG